MRSTRATEEGSFSFHFSIFLFIQNTLSGCGKNNPGVGCKNTNPSWLGMTAPGLHHAEVEAEDQVLLCISSPSQETRYELKRLDFIKHSSWKVTVRVHVQLAQPDYFIYQPGNVNGSLEQTLLLGCTLKLVRFSGEGAECCLQLKSEGG